MINAYFDTKAFMNALDVVRIGRNQSWCQVWHQTGVQVIALKKMREGKQECSIHTLTTLALWSNIDVSHFMKQYEAQTFIQHIEKVEQRRIKAEIASIGRGNHKGCGVRLLLTAGQRTIVIKQPDEWPSVKQVWELFT